MLRAFIFRTIRCSTDKFERLLASGYSKVLEHTVDDGRRDSLHAKSGDDRATFGLADVEHFAPGEETRDWLVLGELCRQVSQRAAPEIMFFKNSI